MFRMLRVVCLGAGQEAVRGRNEEETGHRRKETDWMEGGVQTSRRRRPPVGGFSIVPPTEDVTSRVGRGVVCSEAFREDMVAITPLNRLFFFAGSDSVPRESS